MVPLDDGVLAGIGEEIWPIVRTAKRATMARCNIPSRMLIAAIPLPIILILVQIAIKVLTWWLNRIWEPDGPADPEIRKIAAEEGLV